MWQLIRHVFWIKLFFVTWSLWWNVHIHLKILWQRIERCDNCWCNVMSAFVFTKEHKSWIRVSPSFVPSVIYFCWIKDSNGSSGAPLKPWEVARIQSTGTVSGPVTTTPYSTSNNPEDDQKQQNQIVPSYPSYPRYNTNTYTSPYQSPSPYGMSNGYYGYPTSYPGSGMYGNYNYNRPSPWSHQQPMFPGLNTLQDVLERYV